MAATRTSAEARALARTQRSAAAEGVHTAAALLGRLLPPPPHAIAQQYASAEEASAQHAPHDGAHYGGAERDDCLPRRSVYEGKPRGRDLEPITLEKNKQKCVSSRDTLR